LLSTASQWEAPPGFTAPQPQYPTTTQTPATQQPQTEPSDTTAPKRDKPQDESGAEENSPKRPKRSAPYGRWETVAEYDVEQPVETETEKQAAEAEVEDEEPEIEFEEKTLPQPVKEETDPVNAEYSGGFKKFSFKKSKGGRQMRQRTSEQT